MSLSVPQWITHAHCVCKVMGLIRVGDSEFSLSHADDVMNITSFSTKCVFQEMKNLLPLEVHTASNELSLSTVVAWYIMQCTV